ncbi:hypothetical protein [Streptomyces sp. NPDC000410]|uniref:hypothetical protein n=1 Tax=Streptomyces sp. NPDC000410 TaxID=3154254 RepID=UPI00332713C1
MDVEKREPEGCLTVAIRIPVRIVVLLFVVPVRMLWDVLVVCGEFLRRVMLRPLGKALAFFFEHVVAPVAEAVATAAWWLFKAVFYWPWVALWRYVVVPVARYGIAVPAVWLYRAVLTPIGHGLARVYVRLLTPLGHGVGWLVWAVFYWPWVALWRYVVVPVAAFSYRYVLTPLGHGLRWLGLGLWSGVVWLVKVFVVVPAVFLYRWVLTPVGRFLAVVGREIADAFVVAWRVAGYVSRAVGRALKWLAWNLLGRPMAWFYREVCTPLGHFVRDSLWRPVRRAAVEAGRAVRGALSSVRATVRQARRDAWRALVGGPREREAVEPAADQARNLGRTQHALSVPGAAPGPEISLRKQG